MVAASVSVSASEDDAAAAAVATGMQIEILVQAAPQKNAPRVAVACGHVQCWIVWHTLSSIYGSEMSRASIKKISHRCSRLSGAVWALYRKGGL